MNPRTGSLVLILVAAGAMGSEADTAGKPKEPFYRKYLVAGNRLDDHILEQERRVDASPSDASLRNDFGNLLAERHFANEAVEQYEIASRLDRSNFIALYNLGLVEETQGKTSRAIRAYQKSIERKRGFPQSHFRLGRLYERTGRNAAAVEEYAKALQIDSSMRDPRRNPLVVDSELIYQASLANYSRDIAAASMSKESVYVEESRFRVMPVDRFVSSRDATEAEEPDVSEPRQIGTANAAGSATEPAGSKRSARPGSDATSNPLTGRPRGTQTPMPPRRIPRGGTPMIAAPPGASVAPLPPPPEPQVRQPEPEPPPESMPEPTPAPSEDEEPS